MNVIFKIGEHYYEAGENSIWIQFFLTLLGAFLGFGFALFIYYKNVKREKKEEIQNQKRENENRLKYNKSVIENLSKSINVQIEVLKEFKRKQSKDFLTVVPIQHIVTNDFKRLIYLNKDFFESLNQIHRTNQNWIEELKELQTTTDYIEGTLVEMRRNISSHIEESDNKSAEIKQNIELLHRKFLSLSKTLESELGETKLQNSKYVFVSDFIRKYIDLENNTVSLNKIKNEYLKPINDEIKQNYDDDSHFDEIILLAKKSLIKMNDIENQVKTIIPVFDEIQSELDISIKRVNELNEKLNNVL